MSRHKTRQDLALEYGATDIVSERGDDGVARIKELTKGVGADSVLECVGTQESMIQAIQCARPGAMIGYVGVPHGVELDGQALFFSQKRHAGRPRAGAPLPAAPDGPGADRARSIPARSSTWSCRSPTSPRATAPWTSDARSRRCCGSDARPLGGRDAGSAAERQRAGPPPRALPLGTATAKRNWLTQATFFHFQGKSIA